MSLPPSGPEPPPEETPEPAPESSGVLTPRLGEIVLIRVSLDPPESVAAALRRLLSPAEEARAARARIEVVRRRNTLARGWCRHLLGLALGADPQALVFGEERTGKPRLEGPASQIAVSDRVLSFNLSHSGDHLVAGLALGGCLGVDVELHRPLPELEGVAARVFSEAERAALRRYPDGEPRLAAFYRGWTRKEALLKALGGGLALPLRRFGVTLDAVGENGVIDVAEAVPEDEVIDTEGGGLLPTASSKGRPGGLLCEMPSPAALDPRRLSPTALPVPASSWWVGDAKGVAPAEAQAAVAWSQVPRQIRIVPSGLVPPPA